MGGDRAMSFQDRGREDKPNNVKWSLKAERRKGIEFLSYAEMAEGTYTLTLDQ